jgi:hypothetical protein
MSGTLLAKGHGTGYPEYWESVTGRGHRPGAVIRQADERYPYKQLASRAGKWDDAPVSSNSSLEVGIEPAGGRFFFARRAHARNRTAEASYPMRDEIHPGPRYTGAMDSRLLDTLRSAPSIDLYELSLALDQLLADPRRILDIRRHLHPGAQVMFFDHRQGMLVPGRVLQLDATSVTVQDIATHTRWKLPYPAIVADPASRTESPPAAPPRRVSPGEFQVGDTVGFTDKYLRERIGTVTRINAKTCSILCEGEQWRVSPGLLRKTIDL